MKDLHDFGKKVMNSQPFSVLLGAILVDLQPGAAELALDIRDELRQQHGFVHGGVISYLADNALTFAGGSQLGDSVTSEYKINYLRPATGSRLTAKATVLSVGKKQAVCSCEVFVDAESGEKLVAVAQGTICKVGG